MADLYETIEDSITDSELPADTDVVDTPVETEAAPDTSVDAPVEDTPATDEVASPAVAAEKDDFEKKFGIPGTAASGRENRIPYSRVKKITEKAVADGVAAKLKEFEPQIAERDAKIQDYEGRLTKVAEFEHIMVNDVDQFSGMLRQLPSWKGFFEKFDAAVAGQTQGQVAQAAQTPVTDDMPAPDQQLADGTMVYSMDGLKALLKWNGDQSETRAAERVTKQLAERYKPMEDEWQAHQKVQAIIPQVQSQIAEARQWPLFNEHEMEIVKALQGNERLSLEGAYRQVVYPKLVADRTKMREEILREVQKAPKATSVGAGTSKTVPQGSTGPRALEDVISDSIKGLKQ